MVSRWAQTCTRLQVFVISYLLFWPVFIWWIFWKRKIQLKPGQNKKGQKTVQLDIFSALLILWRFYLPSKNKEADENLQFQRHTNYLIKLKCSVFSSATLFLEGSHLIFYNAKKNIIKWKHIKITNMILRRPEVLCRFARAPEMQVLPPAL